jgi:hypothetical protein
MNELKVIGVASLGLAGIEVYDLNEERVLYKYCYPDGLNKNEKLHRAKIYFDKKEPYFNTQMGKVKLSDVLRVNIGG